MKVNTIATIVASIILLAIIGSIIPDPNEHPAAIARDAEKDSIARIWRKYPYLPRASQYDGSVRPVRAYLENTLNDPGSYTEHRWGRLENHNGTFYVRHSFRARNSFGGMILQDWTFGVDSFGVIVSIIENKN
jgi:hypothetical protein